MARGPAAASLRSLRRAVHARRSSTPCDGNVGVQGEGRSGSPRWSSDPRPATEVGLVREGDGGGAGALRSSRTGLHRWPLRAPTAATCVPSMPLRRAGGAPPRRSPPARRSSSSMEALGVASESAIPCSCSRSAGPGLRIMCPCIAASNIGSCRRGLRRVDDGDGSVVDPVGDPPDRRSRLPGAITVG